VARFARHTGDKIAGVTGSEHPSRQAASDLGGGLPVWCVGYF